MGLLHALITWAYYVRLLHEYHIWSNCRNGSTTEHKARVYLDNGLKGESELTRLPLLDEWRKFRPTYLFISIYLSHPL